MNQDYPGINNGADLNIRTYATPNLKNVARNLLEDIKPFYAEIHAFVRHKLRLHYGPRKVSKNGPIPAHILGN